MMHPGRRGTSRLRVHHLLQFALIFGLTLGVAAGEEFVCRGKIVDAEAHPAVGYRVVYRVVGTAEVALSGATDEQGEYVIDLPLEGECLPVAVISPRGKRIELGEQVPVQPGPDARRDIRLEISLVPKSRRTTLWAPGADRLFRSFVEDPVLVRGQRYEGQIDFADFDGANVLVARALAAFHLRTFPDVELGARGGLGNVDGGPGFGDGSGLTDLDVWAKLYLGPEPGIETEWAIGAVLTLPTGDSDAGLGYEALRSKLFGTVRFNLPGAILSAHAGLRFNEDGELAGFPLDGRLAPAAGIGVLVPLRARQSLAFEANYEGKRFAGSEPIAEVLGGLHWELPRRGAVRFALALGLADGTADTRVLAGYVAEF